MATITVEDGTGLAGATTYASDSEFVAYWQARYQTGDPGSQTAVTQPDKLRGALNVAADYIDRMLGPYAGTRLTATQALEFPRSGLYDATGTEVTGVPIGVKRACIEYAFRALSDDLQTDQSVDATGAQVKRKKIDVIETEYFQGSAKTLRRYPMADALLRPYRIGATNRVVHG